MSDAGAHASQLCDACAPTHLLGHWVRERKALPLEEAVRRLTSAGADAFGLSDRGRLEVGKAGDRCELGHTEIDHTSYLSLILGFGKGASAVDQTAAGAQQLDRGFQDPLLSSGAVLDLVFRERSLVLSLA